jgi:hypothetical protein
VETGKNYQFHCNDCSAEEIIRKSLKALNDSCMVDFPEGYTPTFRKYDLAFKKGKSNNKRFRPDLLNLLKKEFELKISEKRKSTRVVYLSFKEKEDHLFKRENYRAPKNVGFSESVIIGVPGLSSKIESIYNQKVFCESNCKLNLIFRLDRSKKLAQLLEEWKELGIIDYRYGEVELPVFDLISASK